MKCDNDSYSILILLIELPGLYTKHMKNVGPSKCHKSLDLHNLPHKPQVNDARKMEMEEKH